MPSTMSVDKGATKAIGVGRGARQKVHWLAGSRLKAQRDQEPAIRIIWAHSKT